MAVKITRFSLHGANLGRLTLLEAEHDEGLDGTDELEVACYDDLNKHDRLVWRDKQGNWHEHIVDGTERTHDKSGKPVTVAKCINSIAETWDDWITEVRLRDDPVQYALERTLYGSRWQAGTCTQAGTVTLTHYHTSVREALQKLMESSLGELETIIGTDGNKVTSRTAQIVTARGNQDSPKRFTYTKDILSIKRHVGSTNPKTRIYAYGKGEETDTGGYGRRIGIEDVNDGLPYVEDAAATAIWGRPDGEGGLLPANGKYENPECEDPAQLKAEALDYLDQVKAPQVTYTADVIDLAEFGREWEEVALGDRVAIIDRKFSPEGIRLRGRISRIRRDLMDGSTQVTFGTLVDALANPWRTMSERIQTLTNKSTNWDLAGMAADGWLETLIRQLNASYNAVGTYHYQSFEKGEIWSSVPLDEDGNATVEGGWAMNINGIGFRLANSLNPDGSWNWRQFGNGAGFTATEITAGHILGAGGTYIDLESGVVNLGDPNGFHLRIDPTQFGMYQGDIQTAYIENGMLKIPLAVGVNAIQVGEPGQPSWQWMLLDNGNLRLKWTGPETEA